MSTGGTKTAECSIKRKNLLTRLTFISSVSSTIWREQFKARKQLVNSTLIYISLFRNWLSPFGFLLTPKPFLGNCHDKFFCSFLTYPWKLPRGNFIWVISPYVKFIFYECNTDVTIIVVFFFSFSLVDGIVNVSMLFCIIFMVVL